MIRIGYIRLQTNHLMSDHIYLNMGMFLKKRWATDKQYIVSANHCLQLTYESKNC